MARWQRVARSILLASLAAGCRAPAGGALPATGLPADDAHAIRAALDGLYAAFGFDPGGEADWDAIRASCAEGAAFLAPAAPDRPQRLTGLDEFLEDFRAYASSPPVAGTGLHERITGVRVDGFGRIAHAFVAFEGFAPGDGRALTRGLDSLQLVRDGERWLLASFTTQYETPALSLPLRFVAPPEE
ncbi:MAG: nuclear transport factor 2 family protein [Planctomycetes bacterium]|nr:nuclear transport factor 2 family protein [Planctomycetota bacterium]